MRVYRLPATRGRSSLFTGWRSDWKSELKDELELDKMILAEASKGNF